MYRKLFIGIAALTLGTTLESPAEARDIFVRDKPNTTQEIQKAVDRASPGDIIHVGPGNFAGAAIFQTVTIIGSAGTIIDEGNSVLFGGEDAFDIISAGANGTTIRDMTFIGGDFLFGVFGLQADDVTVTNCVFLDTRFGVLGVLADDVTVTNNAFLDTFHAVDNRFGNGWAITDNVMDGYIPFPPIPNPNVPNDQEAILVVAPATDNYIGNNFIRHEGLQNPGYLLERNFGITLISFGPDLENNIVVGNEVEVVVPDAAFSVGVGLIAVGDPAAVRNNTIVDNDLRRSLTPILLVPESLDDSNMIMNNLID